MTPTVARELSGSSEARRRHQSAAAGVIALLGRAGCKMLDGMTQLLSEPSAFALHPLLELVRAIDVEAVEKWPSVQLHHAAEVFLLSGRGKRVDVTRDDCVIQPKLGAANEELRCFEILSQAVARLLEHMAAMLGVRIGPQITDQLFATDAFVVAGRQEGQ